MKYLLTLLLPFLIGTTACGQAITYEDFKSVIPLLQQEDFRGAFQKTSQLLGDTENDSSDLRGIVTYMNIFSAAGMVTQDQMSYPDFTKNANKYIGHWIVMPAHPCIDTTAKGYNSLQFIRKDGQLQGMTIAANQAATHILCFEYFTYAEPVQPAEFLGKQVRCGGILAAVEPNPNQSKIWVARLRVSDAFARVMTPR